jgi:hypothetical protein
VGQLHNSFHVDGPGLPERTEGITSFLSCSERREVGLYEPGAWNDQLGVMI